MNLWKIALTSLALVRIITLGKSLIDSILVSAAFPTHRFEAQMEEHTPTHAILELREDP